MICLSPAGRLWAETDFTPAERREFLLERIDDLRSNLGLEEDAKALAQQHLADAEAEMRPNPITGSVPAGIVFRVGSARSDVRRAESNIRRLRSEIRQCEEELRGLDRGAAARPQAAPANAVGQPIPQGLAAIQGKWLSVDKREAYHIEQNKICVIWSTPEGIKKALGTVTVDADKQYFDFDLGPGNVFRHLFKVEQLPNGKTSLTIQYNPRNLAIRPTQWEAPAMQILGVNSQLFTLESR
ncbi:MAG: hypothetical protein U0939_12255 [Pirellulales bacterium]